MLDRLKNLVRGKSQSADAGAESKKQGDEHLQAGRLDDAVACYRRAVEDAPAHTDALVGLGFALSEQKRHGEAEGCLKRALALDPAIVDAHYILGTIAKERGDDASAADHFGRALALKPDFQFAYRDLFAVLVRAGHIAKARETLGRAIACFPDSAEFHFHLGNVLSHEREHAGAIACYRKALAISPAESEVHKGLADALANTGMLDQAAASYQKAIWFSPGFVDAHVGLGSVRQRQDLTDQAIASYQRAVDLVPRHAAALMALGALLERQRRLDDAIACFRRTVEIEPGLAAAHQHLGNALLEKGATLEAIACFEEVVRLDPANPVMHVITALSGRGSERAPSEYVEQLFDQYAEKFDSHLVGVLRYTVPDKLAALLRPHAEAGGAQWRMLDLGCGTGLSGAAIASLAKHLVGVDLSEKMLDKARERGIYHRLEQLDLLTMMQREAASSFDVVFSADVFVYLGALDDLMSEAARLLRPGGYVAFSVESLDALADDAAASTPLEDYRLNVTGRYAHSIAYLRRMAANNRFDVLETSETQSRLDKGVPVRGYLSLWRKRSD